MVPPDAPPMVDGPAGYRTPPLREEESAPNDAAAQRAKARPQRPNPTTMRADSRGISVT